MKPLFRFLTMVAFVTFSVRAGASPRSVQTFRIVSGPNEAKIERNAKGWIAQKNVSRKVSTKVDEKALRHKNMNALYEHLRGELQQVLAKSKNKKCQGPQTTIQYADLRSRTARLCLGIARERMIAKRFESIMSYAFEARSWHPLAKSKK